MDSDSKEALLYNVLPENEYIILNLELFNKGKKDIIISSLYNLCKYLPNYTVESYVKMASLPYGKVTKKGTWMLTEILEKFEDFNLVVYKSKYPFILNTNRPVLCLRNFKFSKFFDLMVFPISSYYAIVLIKGKINKFYLNVPYNFVKYINKLNFESDSRYVICSKSFKSLDEFKNKIYIM